MRRGSMRRVARVGGVALVSSLIVACGDAAGPSGDSLADEWAVFHEGAWVLTVDRSLRAGGSAIQNPGTALSEADYEPVSVGRSYRLSVVARGARVVVSEPSMVASLDERGAQQLRYNIVSGAFAGGRIVVWRGASGLQGELTIYGSGVPIVQSERGALQEAR